MKILLLAVAIAAGIYQDEQGWTVITPSEDSRIMYVSSSSGDDANDGTESRPVATIAKGKSLMRDDMPDHLLLRRGDVWDESFGFWSTSGRSIIDPQVIGAYGEGDRPVLRTGSGVGWRSGESGLSFIAIQGIEFYAHTRNPSDPAFAGPDGNVGIMVRQDGDWLLVEDCKIHWYQTNISCTSKQGLRTDLIVRRNVICDAYSVGTHSQGIFANQMIGLHIEENVIDHNGWCDDRDTGGRVPGAGATLFNHNLYLSTQNTLVSVAGNLITRASSHGIQLRAGGVIRDNCLAYDALNILFGSSKTANIPNGVSAVCLDNVILHGTDINSRVPRQKGIQVTAIHDAIIAGNIVAHDSGGTTANGCTITALDPITSLAYQRNIFFGWDRGSPGIRGSAPIISMVEDGNYYSGTDEISFGNFDSGITEWVE